jgi:hypothetical protein
MRHEGKGSSACLSTKRNLQITETAATGVGEDEEQPRQQDEEKDEERCSSSSNSTRSWFCYLGQRP